MLEARSEEDTETPRSRPRPRSRRRAGMRDLQTAGTTSGYRSTTESKHRCGVHIGASESASMRPRTSCQKRAQSRAGKIFALTGSDCMRPPAVVTVISRSLTPPHRYPADPTESPHRVRARTFAFCTIPFNPEGAPSKQSYRRRWAPSQRTGSRAPCDLEILPEGPSTVSESYAARRSSTISPRERVMPRFGIRMTTNARWIGRKRSALPALV